MSILRRISGTDFEGAAGAEVTIVAVSQNNLGVEQAFFEYSGQALAPATVLGHPSCRFVLEPGRKSFQTLVVFAPESPHARYDLFQLDAGVLVDLQKGRAASDPNGLIGLRIMGILPALESFRAELSARYIKPRRRASNLAFAAASESVASKSRIHAVGLGTREGTDEPAVLVYVTRKVPLSELAPKDRIPASSQGIPTDVIVSPIPVLASCSENRTASVSPLVGGIAVARHDGPVGTLGCFVRSTRPGDPASAVYLLSNSHVFSPQDGAVEGIPVLQPGGGAQVARVTRATRLTISKPIRADAAIARLDSTAPFENAICEIGKLAGLRAPVKNSAALKHGQKTGRTTGAISAVGLDQVVRDPFRSVDLVFENLFRVDRLPGDSAIALAGDSGSVVVHPESSEALGLLMGADEFGTFYVAHPMSDVFSALDLELLHSSA